MGVPWYPDLPPGMTTVLSSFASHVWVVRDMATNAAISMYLVGRCRFTLSKPELEARLLSALETKMR